MPSIFPSLRRSLAVLGAVASIVCAGAVPGAVAAAAVVRISTGPPAGRAVGAGFLGLALEYRSIPMLAGDHPATVDPVLVQLIRNLGAQAHPVLRIGGQSTDRTWWPVPGIARPLGITYDLTSSWMASARALAQAVDARLILGVGLEADQPRIDAVEAQQLLAGIGRRYIAALEIGNEPELYPVVPWYRVLQGAPIAWYSHLGAPVFSRPPGYDPAAFTGEFRRALQVLPQLPIAGPVSGTLSWLQAFDQFLSARSRVRMVTWHAYGLNQCVTVPSSPQYPTVANLLAAAASRGIVDGISPYVALAHRDRASFRIDEMNSVTCNGRVGVSNIFASALWVMDSLFAIAADGVDGVNIHTYPNAANGLFDLTRSRGRWHASVHPLYYGLLMFAQAAPPGSRLLRLRTGSQDQVRAWATLAPDHRIRVLLINDSLTSAVRAQVSVPASGPASLERLAARSVYATQAITLGGRSFGTSTATGALSPPLARVVVPRSGVYAMTVAPASAALLTFPPPGGSAG